MATLVDQYGRPVRRVALTTPQAQPGLTSVRQAWSPSLASGLTPQRLAGILLDCDEGNISGFVTLAEEMEERDPHYASVLGVRKRAISGIKPTVKPASEDARDEEIAEAVRNEIAEHDGFSDLVEDLLDALGKGFSVVEIDWSRSATRWKPGRFDWRTQRHFTFNRETGLELRLVDEADMLDGVALTPFKFIQHRAKLKSGLPARGGIARLVAFSWMCKAYTLKDWMAFIETYGLPLRLGRYGPEATKDDVDILFSAVANVGTDAAAVLPRSMDIEFEETASSTGDKVFENLARYGDEQVSKAVLGQTMTSDDGSSRAQAEVHNDVRHDIAAADARSVTGTLNRDLVRPYVDLNFGVQNKYPRIILEVREPEDVGMLMTNVSKAAGIGVKFRASEIRAKLGMGDPEAADEVVGGQPNTVAPNSVALNSVVAPNLLDELDTELAGEWRDVGGGLSDAVMAAIDGASSYDDLLEHLPELVRLMNDVPFIEGLVKATFKARGIGDQLDGDQ